MRRLLLLLLTFLLPLQLLAATVGDVASARSQAELALPSWGQAATPVGPDRGLSLIRPAGQVVQLAGESPAIAANAVDAADDPASTQPVGDEDADAPVLQADCEDHTLPARLATPDISWHPFPHAFAAPLNWPSFLRDQLRPPPLA